MYLIHMYLHFVVAVHSVMSDSATPWTAARQASLSFTISQSLLKLMSIQSVMPSNHLILCRPLLLLPSIFPSIRVFSNESALPKCWSLSFSISPLMNIQDWFPLGITGFLSLPSKALSRVFSNATVEKRQRFGTQPPPQRSPRICVWPRGQPAADPTALRQRAGVSSLQSAVCVCHGFSSKGQASHSHGCSHGLQWFLSPRK